MSSLNCL